MAKKDAYSLVVPLDASGTEGYETGRTVQVMVVDARGTHHSEKVKLGAKGAGSASFRFAQTPGSLRVLVGPEDASAEELLGLQALSLDVSLNQWADKRELTLAPIRLPPLFWATVIRRVVVENRSIDVTTLKETGEPETITHTFVLVRPIPRAVPNTKGLPLVIVLHADGDTGADIRTDLPIENYLTAFYAYPDGTESNTWKKPDGRQFNYHSVDGRNNEKQFVKDLIDKLQGEFPINTGRVFIAGMSGGATMANALGCYLRPSVIRGLGIHSGTLYQIETETGEKVVEKDVEGNVIFDVNGGVNGPLPDVRFVWGKEDYGDGTTYATDGQDTFNKYLKTQGCAETWTPVDCVDDDKFHYFAYKGCARAVELYEICGLDHNIWPGAADAFATFFKGLS
jgi:poly(3-hydroxybutyrate) depolymerase